MKYISRNWHCSHSCCEFCCSIWVMEAGAASRLNFIACWTPFTTSPHSRPHGQTPNLGQWDGTPSKIFITRSHVTTFAIHSWLCNRRKSKSCYGYEWIALKHSWALYHSSCSSIYLPSRPHKDWCSPTIIPYETLKWFVCSWNDQDLEKDMLAVHGRTESNITWALAFAAGWRRTMVRVRLMWWSDCGLLFKIQSTFLQLALEIHVSSRAMVPSGQNR